MHFIASLCKLYQPRKHVTGKIYDMYSFLGLHDHILLQEISADDVVSDERALPECQNIEEAVTTMMRYGTLCLSSEYVSSYFCVNVSYKYNLFII